MSLRKKKKKKKTALIVCRDGKQFWTTQTQFWQWFRDGRLTQTGNSPLTGAFCREGEELMVILSNTVLNLAHPNHIREVLSARRVGLARRLAPRHKESQGQAEPKLTQTAREVLSW